MRRTPQLSIRPLWPLCTALWLAGCASHLPTPSVSNSSRNVPSATQNPDRDGPEARIPPHLEQVPDAEPRLEPIRKGGPNKPYDVLGQHYEPITEDQAFTERGLASWYGRKFHGKSTSSGELYNMYAMTAAHATMPIPSYARVRNPANGKEVIVRINDRGPFHSGRIIDLSYTAALKLDILRGVTPVEVERITYEDIRTGAWRRDTGSPPNPAVDEPQLMLAQAQNGASGNARSAAAAAPALTPIPVQALQPDALSGAAAVTPIPVGTAGSLPADGSAAQFDAPPRVAAPGFWVQLGAFSKLDGAEQFHQKLVKELDWMAPMLAIFKEKQLCRLQAGPYASREDARQAADRVHAALALAPIVLERR